MALTKADLAENLFNELGLNKGEAKEFVEIFFEKIRRSPGKGPTGEAFGFGNFTLRQKNPRPGRNPKTGEESRSRRGRVVTFRASHKLKGEWKKTPACTRISSSNGCKKTGPK